MRVFHKKCVFDFVGIKYFLSASIFRIPPIKIPSELLELFIEGIKHQFKKNIFYFVLMDPDYFLAIGQIRVNIISPFRWHFKTFLVSSSM